MQLPDVPFLYHRIFCAVNEKNRHVLSLKICTICESLEEKSVSKTLLPTKLSVLFYTKYTTMLIKKPGSDLLLCSATFTTTCFKNLNGVSKIIQLISWGYLAAYMIDNEAPMLKYKIEIPSSPKCQLFDLVFIGDKFYDRPDILYLLFSIRQVLTFAFAASAKVKSNQVYLLKCNLKTFKFMASIPMKIQYSRMGSERLLEDNEWQIVALIVFYEKFLVLNMIRPELPWNCENHTKKYSFNLHSAGDGRGIRFSYTYC